MLVGLGEKDECRLNMKEYEVEAKPELSNPGDPQATQGEKCLSVHVLWQGSRE
jgi:hypothetical protein